MCVPRLAQHLDIHASDHLSPSAGDAVQGNAVLDCVSAKGVVFFGRSAPNDQFGGLVVLAVGEEAGRDVDVTSGEGPVKGEC